jgi:CRISPR system Cascade subunit CasD
MSEHLILRLDAPLVSFGSPLIDALGCVQAFPALSMLTGLLANALGYTHSEFARLGRLQQRIRYAARTDRAGLPMDDFQIVDMEQPWMNDDTAWTTRHRIVKRGSSTDKHIRERTYRADSVHTVALGLEVVDESPTIHDLVSALREPARPLFLGRKACLPAAPLFWGLVDAEGPYAALRKVPGLSGRRASASTRMPAWWFDDDASASEAGPSVAIPVTDERDWPNQFHVGRRTMRQGFIEGRPQ